MQGTRASVTRLMRKTVYGFLDGVFVGKGVPRTVNGEPIRFPAPWCRYYPSTYEETMHRFLVRNCRPDTTVIDGGAHIGLFTVAMARAVGPRGSVLAFEPTPSTRAVLTTTVALNKLGANVSVRPEGLASSTGRMTFHVGMIEGSNSNSLVGAAAEGSTEQVRTLALDDLLPTLPAEVSCIKLDVEGSEFDALLGGQELLRRAHPSLCIGVHPRMLRIGEREPGQVRDLLLDLGYTLVVGTSPCPPELFDGDYLFDFQAVYGQDTIA